MSRFIRNVSHWFGYSRRERRASFILLILITGIIMLNYFMSERKTNVENLTPPIIFKRPPLKKGTDISPDTSVVFPFDPNSASIDDLVSLGLNRRQIKTLLNYRGKGGRFRKPDDIYNIYGIDSLLAKHLRPYIVIREQQKSSNVLHQWDTSAGYKIKRKVIEETDLNKADSAGLERLPGIGPVLSARIIRYRDLLGGFYHVEQLREVYGISDSTYNLISGRIIADSSAIRMIDINKALFNELARHPYLYRYDVQAILKYKAIKGNIDSIDELVQNKILTSEKAGRIKPYLIFKKRESPD